MEQLFQQAVMSNARCSTRCYPLHSVLLIDMTHPVSFYVHPSFASFHTREYYVRVTARRFSAGNVGMNLIYEVADSRGRAAHTNAGKWFGANAGTDWQTSTWHVTDACFSKMWGDDIVVRPEESVPFAIGPIEVSTVPFESGAAWCGVPSGTLDSPRQRPVFALWLRSGSLPLHEKMAPLGHPRAGMTDDEHTSPAPQNAANRRRFLVPRSRRLTCDVLHFHQQVPLCPHHRMFHLAPLDAIRKSAPIRVSWPVLFLKAYAILARETPVFRQTWMSFPWPTIYQHDTSVGMLAIQREYQAEPWLFWGRFLAPEHTPLPELQRRLDRYQQLPVEQIFKLFLHLSLIPNPLRRFIWWCCMQLRGATRARRVGTFFLSTLASRGVEIDCPPSFQTGVLSYGPIDAAGDSRVTLAYDHRLMDGLLVADSLLRMEQILNGVLADELKSLTSSSESKPA